ncbi:hypothetical protein niasHT_007554 [Heterodera trifolii]|uniref:Uncharacterized protein n=1 Tax=Heterodera trifolii TaxID=157864 RepID=A0ABD2LPI9_9BILA
MKEPFEGHRGAERAERHFRADDDELEKGQFPPQLSAQRNAKGNGQKEEESDDETMMRMVMIMVHYGHNWLTITLDIPREFLFECFAFRNCQKVSRWAIALAERTEEKRKALALDKFLFFPLPPGGPSKWKRRERKCQRHDSDNNDGDGIIPTATPPPITSSSHVASQ